MTNKRARLRTRPTPTGRTYEIRLHLDSSVPRNHRAERSHNPAVVYDVGVYPDKPTCEKRKQDVIDFHRAPPSWWDFTKQYADGDFVCVKIGPPDTEFFGFKGLPPLYPNPPHARRSGGP